MKIIIFGLGDIYSRVKQYFYKANAEIVALIDNGRKLLGTLMDGHVVCDPKHVWQYQFDYIVITSSHAVEMRQQLIELGVQPDKIVHFQDFIGCIPVKSNETESDAVAADVLILTNDFGYHGGPIACVNLARILRQNGYRTTIAVPSAEQKFVDEISAEEDIKVIVVKNLEHLSRENLEWTSKYKYVLANTFVMARCAIKLAVERKVYLWLHENIDSYGEYEYWHEEVVNGIQNDQLVIGAVSDVARDNFLSIYPTKREIELLPYGIDDLYQENDFCVGSGIITFTIVAPHVSRKGVDVLFDAMNFISEKAGNQCRFLFVGKTNDSEYGKQIRSHIDKNVNCEYLGELSREKLFKVYSETDVVIIPSRRDSLPLVATEAMMMKKICIISDATGTTRYIKHKYNGLVFQNENREELAKMVCWCLENREELKAIAENARKTFETFFTMEVFGNNVMNVIDYMR